jgi:hypothetical protein
MQCDGKDREGNACETEATMLARSMDEQECNIGGVHWVKTEDHVYCDRHFVAGRMAHLDHRVTSHAPMSVEDLER